MHLGLTYDLQTDPHDARQAEFDPPATIHALRQALESLGHHVTLMGSADDLLRKGIKAWCDVDLVFNIAEGRHGRCREAWVPMLLESWNIPFVGSDAIAQALGLDKVMSKRLAQASGVTTPLWEVVESVDALSSSDPLPFPLIVKPRYEGSGIGIDPGAVVQTFEELRARADWLLGTFHQPCLIEQFIPFGELTVFLIGNDPPEAFPPIQRPLDPASRLSCHVVAQRSSGAPWLCPVELTPSLDAAARQMASTMFRVIGCRDMARVDLRVDESGRLYFLEINPLPSFDPEGSLGLLAEYQGRPYASLVGRILDAALQRIGLWVPHE